MNLATKTDLVEAAKKAGQWLISNQICDKLDANNGRFLYCYNFKTGYFERSTGWQCAMGAIAMLWLYEVDHDKKYIEAAVNAGQYILSLQVLDPDLPKQFGTFREETPQTQWMHPRDAVSDAWGLLALYQVTKDERFLKASKRYAEWHLKNAWHQGWPVATFKLGPDGIDNDVRHLNCQAGTAAWFLQLAKATGETKYLDLGAIPILNYYISCFLSPSGQPYIFYDPQSKLGDKDQKGFPQSWIEMHRYNDDFASLALLQGYKHTDNSKFLDAVYKYASWVTKGQNQNGSFGDPEVEVASSCIPIFMLDLVKLTSDSRFEPVIDKAIHHLLTLQIESEEPKANGAFLCLNNRCQRDPNSWVNIRNTSYSIVALLKAAGYAGPALSVTA